MVDINTTLYCCCCGEPWKISEDRAEHVDDNGDEMLARIESGDLEVCVTKFTGAGREESSSVSQYVPIGAIAALMTMSGWTVTPPKVMR